MKELSKWLLKSPYSRAGQTKPTGSKTGFAEVFNLRRAPTLKDMAACNCGFLEDHKKDNWRGTRFERGFHCYNSFGFLF
jgi:hypothetical protein